MHSPSLTAQPQLNRPGASIKPKAAVESPWPFRFVLLSLVFEFGRPQEIIPGLNLIPFPTFFNLAILASLVTSGKLNLKNPQTQLWWPILALMFVHVPFALNNYTALMTLKGMALTLCLYLGIVTYSNSLARVRTLVGTWINIHIVTSIIGIWKGGFGVGGWMGDENDFCMTINMALPFAFFMSYASSSFAFRARNIGLLLMFVFTVTITLSRGGFFGMLAVGVYCWLKSPHKLMAVVLVAILSVFVLIAAPAAFWAEIGSSFSDETIEQGTGGDRLYIWGIGFEMFLANPIWGVGQDNFPWTFEQYEGDRTFMEASRAGRAAHSLYVSLLAEMGLIGSISFFLMNWHNFLNIRMIENLAKSQQRPLVAGRQMQALQPLPWVVYAARAMEGSMVGYLVSSVFISTSWYPSFWVMTGFIVALRNLVVEKGLTGEGPQKVDVAGTGPSLSQFSAGRQAPTRSF